MTRSPHFLTHGASYTKLHTCWLVDAMRGHTGSLFVTREGMTPQCFPNLASTRIAFQRHLLLLILISYIQLGQLSYATMSKLQLFRSCKACGVPVAGGLDSVLERKNDPQNEPVLITVTAVCSYALICVVVYSDCPPRLL